MSLKASLDEMHVPRQPGPHKRNPVSKKTKREKQMVREGEREEEKKEGSGKDGKEKV